MRELHSRVTRACCQTVGGDYELILVNDRSADATWDLITELADRDPHVVGVNLSRNHGHQLALTAGLSVSRGERILAIDGDLQDPPELLGRMMELMDAGADVVYGQRSSRSGESRFKLLTAKLFYRLLQRLTDVPIPVDTGDFRLMSRRVVEALNAMPEEHRFLRGMVSWVGFRQVPLLYERHPRFAGSTRYPLAKMLQLALDAVTGFSVRPLRIASYLGVLFSLVGVLLLAYAMASWLFGQTVRGWTSLIATILLLGSAQLLVLGVIGEYLGRLYLQAKHRPLFIIDEIRRADPGASPRREDGEPFSGPRSDH